MKSINKVNCFLKNNFNTLSTIMTIPSREINGLVLGFVCVYVCVGGYICVHV